VVSLCGRGGRDHPVASGGSGSPRARAGIVGMWFPEDAGVVAADELPGALTARYTVRKQIGRGSGGHVHHATENSNSRDVAIKVVPLVAEDEGVPVVSLREVALLRSMSHPNILELLDVFVDLPLQQVCMVLPYMQNDLKSLLRTRFKLGMPRRMIASTMRQTFAGLAYLHDSDILHRDLKPMNVLVDESGTVKLADFGLARVRPKGSLTQEVVTLWYRAPELLLGQQNYTAAVDMWAAGCMLAELALNRPLLAGDSEIGQILCICKLLGTPTEASWPGVVNLPNSDALASGLFPCWRSAPLADRLPEIDPATAALIAAMVRYVPSSRLEAHEALMHPYFTGDGADADANRTAEPPHLSPPVPPVPIDATPPPTPTAVQVRKHAAERSPPSKRTRYVAAVPLLVA